MIHPERVRRLNAKDDVGGRYVLYWMQASQRAEWNHALEYSVRMANRKGQPLVCGLGLTADYPEANLRHYRFMLEGLKEVKAALLERGILFVVRLGEPPEVITDLAQDASAVVVDRGYLGVQRQWRAKAATSVPCSLTEVESDAVVPVGVASGKEEYAAATLRPRINRHLSRFLRPLEATPVRRGSVDLRIRRERLDHLPSLLQKLDPDPSVGPVAAFRGGTPQANRLLRAFLRNALDDYAARHSEPSLEVSSRLSPYLHFGQISPLRIALAVRAAKGRSRESKEAFLEEIIVRRELSLNFVHHNRSYSSFRSIPPWAVETLRKHERDRREPQYSLRQLERAATHDPYWNAAMEEMFQTGFMHNHMRMYWGKKILEWSRTPEQAFRRALRLNNKYFLDGRDPNSFASIAWCFGKHDRPWGERAIFGKVRYMNARGLERKFNMRGYLERVDALKQT